eukprot:CAMPEP_0168236230 /NCGR_PEP_ID=MMETSP0140_2-20121125/19407_1 /TAXON_ID=44445 /ORGANISM="Pseudo-nitzschia australis, Strain 10249 10 AB" /LENGTH=784 /DNA_ID=CAMNT_0008169513 /DNA_START=164 /DNA_END=2518 /DNA_ORIENTATION=-
MSGRGRGISNAPAWMTRQNQNQLGNGGGGGGGGGGDGVASGLPPPPSNSNSNYNSNSNSNNYSNNLERDAFGRTARGGGGPPLHYPHSHSHQLPPQRGDGNMHGNGNGNGYDDRRRYDDRRNSDRRRGGPQDDWNNGRRGGGRRDMYRGDVHRDGGGRDRDRDYRRSGNGNNPKSSGSGNSNGNNPNNNNGPGDDTISSSSREQLGIIVFRSYDEEQDWADERRRKRKARPSKFDVPPTPQQLAEDAAVTVASNPGATDFAGIPAGRDFTVVPQQTRHARRLYIGHLPPNVHEQELHDFFRTAIDLARVKHETNDDDKQQQRQQQRQQGHNSNHTDPILSVYINHERRFCFLEFRDVAMTTACMALDGININGKGKVKVKRPNDYNPTMAPKVHPTGVPILDVSKLGIISSNVQDGPNKVFIGGLHYHLTEPQVLELLQAFGKVKAFHLVKNEPDAMTSKGYCFVEFSDPNATPVAVMGLNGMDMGGGKVLTARVAGQRGQSTTGVVMQQQQQHHQFAQQQSSLSVGGAPTGNANANVNAAMMGGSAAAPGSHRLIINGYDIEALVDAAMGLKPMPFAPTHVDQYGVPITKMGGGSFSPSAPVTSRVPIGMPTGVPGFSPAPSTVGVPPPPPPQLAAAAALPPGSSALDIANAALDAAFGPGSAAAPAPPPPPPPPPPMVQKTRILVLLNMVENEDLESDEEYKGLMEEVEEEVKKFGKLLSIQVPRRASGSIEASAVGKIFLEYATTQDAGNAEQELSGRQFGPNVVQAKYHDEQEYAALKLR